MFKEFKEFAIKGNAIDLAIGVIIGAAFGKIVDSLVHDIILPPFGLLLGNIDFSSLKWTFPSGAVLAYGTFINAVINFLIIAFAIFLVVKQINRFRRKPAAAPSEKICPYCKMSMNIAALRCPHCTSQLS